MGLVNDDGEVVVADVSNGIADEGEFLDCGDNDALSLLDGCLQFFGGIGMCNDSVAMTKGLDVAGNLFIQQATVGDHDGGIEQGHIQRLGPDGIHGIRAQADEFVGQPGDGIGFTGACGMFNEVSLANAHGGHVCIQF